MAEVELGALVAGADSAAEGASADIEEVLAMFTVGDSVGIAVRVSAAFVEGFVDIAEVETAGINVKEDLS